MKFDENYLYDDDNDDDVTISIDYIFFESCQGLNY